MAKDPFIEQQPLWYKDAIIYQVHVKSFFDSNENGIGDFRGLIKKLDYIESLGVTAIWLMPFYPSPLKDDGYDISRYFDVHSDYGTMRDLKDFLKEAHKRGIRVITELVLNHTSDQHAWFQRARKAKEGSIWRDFYVWSNTPEKYKDVRIIFKDFETSNWAWDPVAKAYYWHRFYTHQPDLNYDNPAVHRSLLKVVDDWLSIGVDGLRLDAVPYLYEREGTNCENLKETYDFLKKLRSHIDAKFKDKVLIAEANQWPEDAVAYFGNGDICQMAFHFPLMPRIFMAFQLEDRFPVIDILEQTPHISDSSQWAIFLRNHDELTLEMVTDEERDYMYKVYAKDPRARINLGIRRRLAPLIGNNRRAIELMNILLLTLPGTPIIYYGDEIGMGDNYYLGDRNGVRTPMQWSSDRNAGFSRANPQKLFLPVIIDPEYHFESLNVDNQDRNPSSLLWWMKRAIAARKGLKSLSRGNIEFPKSDNHKILAFTRQHGNETVLIAVNLSRFPQAVEIDLSKHAGCTPFEVFSGNRFPAIKETPYTLTMGFHDYYLLVLKKDDGIISEENISNLWAKDDWTEVLEGRSKEKLEDVLSHYLLSCRWFRSKARTIRSVRIMDDIGIKDIYARFIIMEVDFIEGASEIYLLPISFAVDEEDKKIKEAYPQAVISRLEVNGNAGILYDGSFDEKLRQGLLLMIARRGRIRGKVGELDSFTGRRFRSLLNEKGLQLSSEVLKADQTNTGILYENTFFLKMYRKLEEGINPEQEMLTFLTEKANFPNVPPFAGSIEYRRPGSEPMLIAQLQGFAPSQGDAWTYTLEVVHQYLEMVLSKKAEIKEIPHLHPSLFGISFSEIPPLLQELIGGAYSEVSSLIGKRTGELHLAITSYAYGDPDFSPEPFSLIYQRSIYQSMRSHAKRILQLLGKNTDKLSEDIRDDARKILDSEQEIVDRYQKILKKKISTMKTRFHGDLHLGQILYTGKDFMFIDFEGEPAHSLSERRLKRSPLRDVAGMIRSFHYAAYSAFNKYAPQMPKDLPYLETWADLWYHYVSGIFLDSYLSTVKGAPFIPENKEDLETLLNSFLLDKAIYELGYELNNRPDWTIIPIKGIRHILNI